MTALKATNLAEEHSLTNLTFRGTEGIQPCESICNSGQNGATLFTFQSITTGDVQKIVSSLPSNNAPGCDKVNVKILKDSSPIITPIISSLINNSKFSTSLEAEFVEGTNSANKLKTNSNSKNSKQTQTQAQTLLDESRNNINQGTVRSPRKQDQFHFCLLYLKYVKEQLTHSSSISSSKAT